MAIVRIVAPTITPVTLEEVKKHVIATDFTDDDDILQIYLDAAIDHLDGFSGILGRALMSQKWAIQYPDWRECFTLPMGPVKSFELRYFDTTNVERTVPSTAYVLSGETVLLDKAFQTPGLARRGDAISAVFTVGETDVDAVPKAIKTVILLMVGGLYANRGQTGGQVFENPTFDLLLGPYRRMHP